MPQPPPPNHTTPVKASSASHSAYRLQPRGQIKDTRKTFMETFGAYVDVIPINLFKSEILPPLPSAVHVESVKGMLERRQALSVNGFSAMLNSSEREHETHFYAPLAAIHDLIVEVAISLDNKLSPTLRYTPCGNKAPASDRPHTTRPDGYEILSKSLPIHSDKCFAGNKELPDNWIDVVRCDEYKKDATEGARLDNVEKLFWNAHHILRYDARRRFTFGLTIEKTATRIWFFNRQVALASEQFDYMLNPEHLIHLVISLSFANISDLGFDTSMKLYRSPSGTTFDYEFEIDSKTYRTIKVLSDFRADAMRSRATRVFEAREVKDKNLIGRSVAIKDTWMDLDRRPEGAILDDVLKDLPSEFHQYFRRISFHGYVSAGKNTVDTTSSHLRNINLEKAIMKSLAIVNLSGKDAPPQQSVGLEIDADHPQSPAAGYIYYVKAHYRVVFEDVCSPLDDIRQWPVIYKVLGEVVKVLKAMYNNGKWVHRDLSPGNILIHPNGHLQLSDLEFATRIDSESEHHAMRTGTLSYMAIEISAMRYWFLPSADNEGPSEDDEPFETEDNAPMELPQAPSHTVTAVVHHTLHDLESVWWIFVRFLWRFVPDHPSAAWDPKLLKQQEKISMALFPRGSENPVNRFAAFVKSIADQRSDLVDAYCRDTLTRFAVTFQRRLLRAYKDAEKDLRMSGKLRFEGFPAALNRIESLFKAPIPNIDKVPQIVHIHEKKIALGIE